MSIKQRIINWLNPEFQSLKKENEDLKAENKKLNSEISTLVFKPKSVDAVEICVKYTTQAEIAELAVFGSSGNDITNKIK